MRSVRDVAGILDAFVVPGVAQIEADMVESSSKSVQPKTLTLRISELFAPQLQLLVFRGLAPSGSRNSSGKSEIGSTAIHHTPGIMRFVRAMYAAY